jgi:hypothetical protein
MMCRGVGGVAWREYGADSMAHEQGQELGHAIKPRQLIVLAIAS